MLFLYFYTLQGFLFYLLNLGKNSVVYKYSLNPPCLPTCEDIKKKTENCVKCVTIKDNTKVHWWCVFYLNEWEIYCEEYIENDSARGTFQIMDNFNFPYKLWERLQFATSHYHNISSRWIPSLRYYLSWILKLYNLVAKFNACYIFYKPLCIYVCIIFLCLCRLYGVCLLLSRSKRWKILVLFPFG